MEPDGIHIESPPLIRLLLTTFRTTAQNYNNLNVYYKRDWFTAGNVLPPKIVYSQAWPAWR